MVAAGFDFGTKRWVEHNKFAVIDVHGADPRVITGSCDWTSAGAESNDENTLIIHDAATAQAYYAEYLRPYQAIPQDAICSRHSAGSGMPACQDGMDNDYDNLAGVLLVFGCRQCCRRR